MNTKKQVYLDNIKLVENGQTLSGRRLFIIRCTYEGLTLKGELEEIREQ